jgi:hypothetical protein
MSPICAVSLNVVEVCVLAGDEAVGNRYDVHAVTDKWRSSEGSRHVVLEHDVVFSRVEPLRFKLEIRHKPNQCSDQRPDGLFSVRGLHSSVHVKNRIDRVQRDDDVRV